MTITLDTTTAVHSMYLLMSCVAFIGFATGTSDRRASLRALQGFILGRISKSVPPYSGNDSVINVTVTFSPLTLISLDSASQVLSLSGYLEIYWFDVELKWNSSDHGGHNRVEVDHKATWKPQIVLSNSIDNLAPIIPSQVLDIFENGLIMWRMTDIFRTSCKINVKNYPFDTQHCRLTFVSTAMDGIQLFARNLGIDLLSINIYDKNGEWTFTNTSYQTVSLGSDRPKAASFSVTLQRKYTYYLMNIILPMSLMSVLNPCVFLIPSSSGEKLAFLMAVFVSHSMFLTLIHQIIPPTSDNVSKLSIFVSLLEVQGFLTILATIAVLGVHHRRENQENVKMEAAKENSLVSVKCRREIHHCGNISLERWMDRIFFILSLGLSASSCGIWLTDF